jgi:hypothetical protein
MIAWGSAKAEIPNPKLQVPRNFQIPMIQNQWRRLSGSGRLFENFSVGISLELGSWSFHATRWCPPGSYECRAVGAKHMPARSARVLRCGIDILSMNHGLAAFARGYGAPRKPVPHLFLVLRRLIQLSRAVNQNRRSEGNER